MRSLRNSFLNVAIAVSVVAMSGSASQADKVRLMLDFALQGQQSPFVLAAEGGYFARAGVEVEVDRGYGSADAITKVATGVYQMAFADLGAMIQFDAKQGSDKLISVFQVYDVAPMVVLSLKKSNIRTPADLAGKKLASPPGASSRVMFPLLAAANHLDPSSVEWLNVNPQLRETLLAKGQTDATTALITDLAGLDRLGLSESDLSIMRYGDFGVRLYGHCILTTPQFAAGNPETVKGVVKAMAEALKAAIANPGLAIAAEKKREPLIDENVERRRLQLVIDNAILTDEVKRAGLGAVEPERLQQTIAMIAKVFDLPAADPQKIYRPDFLPPRAELTLN
jgi:NitT/TauT family transport system substrate-binding protein